MSESNCKKVIGVSNKINDNRFWRYNFSHWPIVIFPKKHVHIYRRTEHNLSVVYEFTNDGDLRDVRINLNFDLLWDVFTICIFLAFSPVWVWYSNSHFDA